MDDLILGEKTVVGKEAQCQQSMQEHGERKAEVLNVKNQEYCWQIFKNKNSKWEVRNHDNVFRKNLSAIPQ